MIELIGLSMNIITNKNMRVVFTILTFNLLFFGCDKCWNDPACDGNILISELRDKNNYKCPLLLKNDLNAEIYLNDKRINDNNYNLTVAGFYSLVLIFSNHIDTIRFNLLDQERGYAEWGLKKWIPKTPDYNILTNEIIDLICPKTYISNINIPFLFVLREHNKISDKNLRCIYRNSNQTFNINHGIGSISVHASSINNTCFSIGEHDFNQNMMQNDSPVISLSGSIIGNQEIYANSILLIKSNLTIESSGSLLINEGCIVLLGEGVNINNNGPVTIKGSINNPVLFTCLKPEKFWGGFISNGSNAVVKAQYTFFCQSGSNNGAGYNYGHAKRQALFKTVNSELHLSACYIIDNKGQIFYPENSRLFIDSVIINRAKTGGQINWSQANITNSVFSDFPDDTQEYCDEDNDGLYIYGSNIALSNCIFMNAKDDGLDSGSDAGGEIIVRNCIFESCFHEGVALSSIEPAIKSHKFVNCLFQNCQQGLELGYSSSGHKVEVDSCIFKNNFVGIRYGDNYEWNVDGKLIVKNSVSIFNELDIWNMVHQNWAPKILNIQFFNTKVSSQIPIYPELILYE